ncbi:sulfotransferase [soil metagenome]
MPPPLNALSLPALMERAAGVAGLTEWGDRGFTEAAELLVESCVATADLNAVGERVLRSVVVRHLANRLMVNAHVRAHPDVAARSLGSPLVITGLPRTGTTLLHNLLALDANNRVLRFWQALRPVPPDPASGESEADLVAQAAMWLERLYEIVPTFRAIHGATAEGPEECDALLQNEFASQHFDDMFNAVTYSAWLATADLRRQYASYTLQLRVLTEPSTKPVGHDTNAGAGGGRWVLKSPSHLGHLDALLAACPEATIVHCHRHPNEAVPSYASLVFSLRRAYSDRASPAVIGAQALERCQTALNRALQVRAGHEARFADVAYSRLMGEPIAAVHDLYARQGWTFPDGFEADMARWLSDHPQHEHGPHRYRGEGFGLTTVAIAAAMAAYLDQFEAAIS